MKPEGSLPCSQEPSTGPYPEPDQSNPYHPILSQAATDTHTKTEELFETVFSVRSVPSLCNEDQLPDGREPQGA
jgi:hypothetical protein